MEVRRVTVQLGDLVESACAIDGSDQLKKIYEMCKEIFV